MVDTLSALQGIAPALLELLQCDPDEPCTKTCASEPPWCVAADLCRIAGLPFKGCDLPAEPPMVDPAFRIQVTDLATGDEEAIDVALNDYFLITTGGCELSGVQTYPMKGTHVLTIKGQRAKSPASIQPLAASTPPPEAPDA